MAAKMHAALRVDEDLRARLQEAAAANGRTLSQEMEARLAQSFQAASSGSADPRFANLLKAISYAASAAAKMYPAKSTTISRRLANELGADSEEVEDTSALYLFRDCIPHLLDPFWPIGVPASLPRAEDREKYLRQVERIAGAALGALGDPGLEAVARTYRDYARGIYRDPQDPDRIVYRDGVPDSGPDNGEDDAR